ncbi:MAG: hypothetical protein ACLFTK_18110 [Anaerolineales bacterium]
METLWEIITLPFQALECMVGCLFMTIIFGCILGIVVLAMV